MNRYNLTMDAERFYQARQDDWQRLTQLLGLGEANLAGLSPAEISELAQLYRLATSDLALAQRDFPGQRVTLYLNQLVGRAHAVIYQGEPLALNRLWRFATAGFPRAFRQQIQFIALSALLLFAPALAAGLATAYQPDAARWLLPVAVQRLIPQIEEQSLWTDIPIAERPYTSSFIMSNNIRVAFLAFGGGILAGLLTVYVMIFNGLLLGGILGLTVHHGVGFELATFIVGHGVIELTVIAIAGGSGLRLGWALLHPGLHFRRDALILAARQALRLILGCVPLLVLAGLIEGFISPSEFLPPPVKWGVGLVTGVALAGYLFFAGRSHHLTTVLSPSTPDND